MGKDDAKKIAAERCADRMAAILEALEFQSDLPFERFEDGLIFRLSHGFGVGDARKYVELIDSLVSRFPNIVRSVIEKHTHNTLGEVIDTFLQSHEEIWQQTVIPRNLGLVIASKEELQAAAELLLTNLSSIVRDYIVFVPLMGVELAMPEYDLGPVKLVRTQDSLPLLEQTQETAEFKYVHQDIMTRFKSFPCLVESQVTGDTEYARQEGLHRAGHLAAILNLHFAQWSFLNRHRQKTRCVGVPPAYSTVILVRTNLPDEIGNTKPTYLHGTRVHSIAKQTLNQTDLNMVRELGFISIWTCFTNETRHSDERSKRLSRAVSWFDKAVNFDEPDAQFVGLATSIEILLVRSGDVSNVFSSWTGITQQLAERCGYLLAHDIHSMKEIVSEVKTLYGIRSKIVHTGAEPTLNDVEKMAELAGRVILSFAQKNFGSFDRFEEWTDLLKYSINFNEIDRYEKLYGSRANAN